MITRRRSRAPKLLASVLTVAALALAACGGGGSGSSSEAGVLNYGYDWGLSSFDPHKSGRSLDNPWLFPVYDRLVHQLPSGEASPGLATDWEFNATGDELTFTLREGVTFHDGEPFDGAAVKANLERAKGEGSTVAADLTTVEAVEVVDDLTVRLDLTGPNASLVLTLSERSGMMISPAAFDNPDLGRNPVGAGMFTVTEYNVGSSAVYEPYADYWDPDAVKLEKLEIFEMADASTRRNALQSGQLNWAKIATTDVAAFDGADNFDVEFFDSLSYINLAMNRSREFFADERVRQAMNYAVDREAILETVYGGYGAVAVQPFPEGYFATDEDAADLYKHDPARAIELLEEAGYPDGFEIEHIVPSTGEGPRIAEILQAQLAEVGITMTITTIDPTQASDLWGVQLLGDTLQGTWGGRPDPSVTLFAQYMPDGFFNVGSQVDQPLIDLYEQTLSTLDPDARAEVLKEASARVADAGLDVVLLFPSTPNVISKDVSGAEAYTTGHQDFRGVSVGAE